MACPDIHRNHQSYPQADPGPPKAPLWGQPGEAEAERADAYLYQILKLDVYLNACTMGYLGLPFLTFMASTS